MKPKPKDIGEALASGRVDKAKLRNALRKDSNDGKTTERSFVPSVKPQPVPTDIPDNFRWPGDAEVQLLIDGSSEVSWRHPPPSFKYTPKQIRYKVPENAQPIGLYNELRFTTYASNLAVGRTKSFTTSYPETGGNTLLMGLKVEGVGTLSIGHFRQQDLESPEVVNWLKDADKLVRDLWNTFNRTEDECFGWNLTHALRAKGQLNSNRLLVDLAIDDPSCAKRLISDPVKVAQHVKAFLDNKETAKSKSNDKQAAPLKPEIARPKSESWDDLEEAELPELKIIMEGVLNQGAKMTVGGSSKMGKTWLLMDLAVSIATGQEWLGIKTYAGKVLYVNFELQKQFFKKRGMSIKHAKGIPDDVKIPNLRTWTLRGNFMTAEEFKKAILEEIGTDKFDVIIIDPLYKLLNGADANSAGDMQKILAELEQIAEQAQAALIYVDHFSKGNQANKAAIDRISGSGVTARDPDVIATFTEHKEPGAFSLQWTLRNFKPVPQTVVSQQENGYLFEKRPDLDPLDLKKPGTQKGYTTQQLLNALPLKGLSGNDWFSAIHEQTGMAEKTYRNLRTELQDDGMVKFFKKRDLWIKKAKCPDEDEQDDPFEDNSDL